MPAKAGIHTAGVVAASTRNWIPAFADEMVSSPFLIGVVMRHDGDVTTISTKKGGDHGKDYDDWTGFGKERFSRGVL
jgi:hypothetical protein